jgi:glycosyltransferase involved in cell wall biosynthesis
MPIRIAYLVNQYPKVSHSFIRREILALERLGAQVQRFAVRGWDAETVDPEDRAEQQATRYLLDRGVGALVAATIATAGRHPHRFLGALRCCLELSRRADRPWPYHLIYLMQACQLSHWLQISKADHLHAHFGTNPAEVAVLVSALGGPPCSFTVHGPEEFDAPVALHLGRKAIMAAFVVAISSYGRSQLFRWLPQSHWGRVKVVHCGLEPAFHRHENHGVETSKRLVCVGRICEQKGQLLLVEAAARLWGQGEDFELVLAGDGGMRAEVEKRLSELGFVGKVRITGWISSDQVREELLASRALVLPSFAEGLPVVIMEAMALRRPVVSTFVAGIPELVEDGVSGWLCPAGDVDALVKAMRQCLEAPADVLARMGENARLRVLERHDVDREAAKLLALVREAGVERTVSALAAGTA